jgi:uncharacterized membrane protein
MHRISWHWRLLAVIGFFVIFGILGYCTRVPKLNPTEVDDAGMTNAEKLSQEYGQEAYNRLREKYGDQ